jgi:hypothetical protein
MSARTLTGFSPVILSDLSLEEFCLSDATSCVGDSFLTVAAAKVAKASIPMSIRGVLLTVYMTETIRSSFICDSVRWRRRAIHAMNSEGDEGQFKQMSGKIFCQDSDRNRKQTYLVSLRHELFQNLYDFIPFVKLLGRPRHRWEDNIKMDLREIGIDGANWIQLAQGRVQWRACVNTVMNLRVP